MKIKYLLSLFLIVFLVFSLAAFSSGSGAGDKNPATSTTHPTLGADIVSKFIFTNTSPTEICKLYLSPIGTESWGPDQLNGQNLHVGEQFVIINILSGVYDAKVVSCNGSEQALQIEIKN
jgi:hypothetical protein